LVARKALSAARGRMAAASARKREKRKDENSFTSISDIGKLSDCTEKDPEKREIFIVEGDSAGGSARQGRDTKTQAIYALRGKPLNTHDAQEERIARNKEFADLV